MPALPTRSCRRPNWPALREALTKVRAGDDFGRHQALIDGFATGETAGPVAAMQAKIDGWFAHDRMEDIVAALQRDGSELAQATLKTLSEKSPRGMVVTLKLLRLARTSSSLEECLVREYRAALEVFASDDFREGVRAAVIDKDRNPKWSPPRIEDVTPDDGGALFRRDRRRRTQVQLNQQKRSRGGIRDGKYRIHRPRQYGRADGGQSGQGRPQGDRVRSGRGLARTRPRPTARRSPKARRPR